jgi:hypothetical protein
VGAFQQRFQLTRRSGKKQRLDCALHSVPTGNAARLASFQPIVPKPRGVCGVEFSVTKIACGGVA